MKENYSNQIVEFLKNHSLISINSLEKELNIPQSTIGQALNGSRVLPLKFMWPITCKLIQYGFKPFGYDFEEDKETNTIFGRKWVKNIKNKKDNHLIWVIEEERILASDITDLI